MEPQRLLKFLRLLESAGIEYMVTGSIAAILYGKPRLTNDMDLVIILPQNKIEVFRRHFDTDEFYCPPLETIREEAGRGDQGHMNIIDQASGFKIDLYPFKEDPLVQWGLEHRKRVELLPGENIWVAPPEYVILKKLCFYQEGGGDKHLEDIRGMLDVSGNEMDKEVLSAWAKRLHLETIWNTLG